MWVRMANRFEPPTARVACEVRPLRDAMSTGECDEDSHPREWILFESIDVDGDRILQKKEVEAYFGEWGTRIDRLEQS